MAKKNSWEGRVNAEWGNINPGGNCYVNDANVSMGLSVLKSNYAKLLNCVEYYVGTPEIMADMGSADINRLNNDLAPIRAQLEAKKVAYEAAIRTLTPSTAPVLTTNTPNPGATTTPNPAVTNPTTTSPATTTPATTVPGASEGTSKDPVVGQPAPSNGTTAGTTTPSATAKKIPMWAWISAGVLVVVIAGALLIKKKKP